MASPSKLLPAPGCSATATSRPHRADPRLLRSRSQWLASCYHRTDERLLYGAKTDNADMINDVFGLPEAEWDVNFQDGLGNTGQSSLAGVRKRAR